MSLIQYKVLLLVTRAQQDHARSKISDLMRKPLSALSSRWLDPISILWWLDLVWS